MSDELTEAESSAFQEALEDLTARISDFLNAQGIPPSALTASALLALAAWTCQGQGRVRFLEMCGDMWDARPHTRPEVLS